MSMYRRPREIELSIPYSDLVESLYALDADGFVALVEDVEDHFCEWDMIVKLKAFVDRRHKALAKEEAEDLSQREGRCVRSAEYEDIWVHTSPHKGCILR